MVYADMPFLHAGLSVELTMTRIFDSIGPTNFMDMSDTHALISTHTFSNAVNADATNSTKVTVYTNAGI